MTQLQRMDKKSNAVNTLRFVMFAFLIAGLKAGIGVVVAFGLANYMLGAVLAVCAVAVLGIATPHAECLRSTPAQ